MCLEHIDRLDGVFLLSSTVDGQDCLHSIHCHRRKQVIVAGFQFLRAQEVATTYAEMILEDMEVFATFTSASRPNLSTLVDS
jgi:hypothetical protein